MQVMPVITLWTTAVLLDSAAWSLPGAVKKGAITKQQSAT